MKIISFAAALLLLAGCATSSNLPGPVAVDGTWRGQVDGGGGMGGPPMEITYNFKRDGDTLSGTVSGGAPDSWIPITEGKINGAKISFTIHVTSQWMANTFKYKGKFIDNDTIKMSYRMKMGGGGMGMGPSSVPGKITVKRVK